MIEVNLEQGTSEWHEFRKNHIGSSDAPAIMGMNPWKSPYRCWREKLGLEETPINEAMQRGMLLESEARQNVSAFLEVELNPSVRKIRTVPFMAASLDAISDDDAILVEIKCPTKRVDHFEDKRDMIPTHYRAQLQHQLFVCELEKMYFYTYFGNGEGTLLEVYRDDKFIKELILIETDFWECMQTLTPPKSPEINFILREDEEFSKVAVEWKNINQQMKELEKKEKEARDCLIKLCAGQNVKNSNISVSKIVRKGNIDYSSIPELKGVDLEKHRKGHIETWRIS